MEQTYSDISTGNKIEVHEFWEVLGLLDNEVQAKNELFVAFSKSNLFGVLEHNVLLDAQAHLVKGLNLFEYDELGFDLINNVKL
ncbi:22723_t:CDS:2 [Cetraspora pellucida]|uniref:22723_t:CDS:1 n=1 Tax=Cetraspora pellucida TaxID=1433469 RepID=A0A9N9A9Q0_9GLOM|nr:22723_t:CDS:2 [Cetraspora pellucida]